MRGCFGCRAAAHGELLRELADEAALGLMNAEAAELSGKHTPCCELQYKCQSFLELSVVPDQGHVSIHVSHIACGSRDCAATRATAVEHNIRAAVPAGKCY